MLSIKSIQPLANGFYPNFYLDLRLNKVKRGLNLKIGFKPRVGIICLSLPQLIHKTNNFESPRTPHCYT